MRFVMLRSKRSNKSRGSVTKIYRIPEKKESCVSDVGISKIKWIRAGAGIDPETL